jgi:hypothetical protein
LDLLSGASAEESKECKETDKQILEEALRHRGKERNEVPGSPASEEEDPESMPGIATTSEEEDPESMPRILATSGEEDPGYMPGISATSEEEDQVSMPGISVATE